MEAGDARLHRSGEQPATGAQRINTAPAVSWRLTANRLIGGHHLTGYRLDLAVEHIALTPYPTPVMHRFVHGSLLAGFHCRHVHPLRAPHVAIRIGEVAAIHEFMVFNGIYVDDAAVFGDGVEHGINLAA